MKQSSIAATQQMAVTDARSCEAWLARATLADPRQACHELTALLESLEDSVPPEGAYLDVLERLREPIAVAQGEHSKKFTGRPLPLKDFETAAFEQVYDVWASLGRGYRRLLKSAIEDQAPALQGQESLVAQRALDCVAELMVAHYRCRREIDAELWQDLHQIFQAAESGNFHLRQVPAGLRSKSVSSCAEVYMRALLLILANPYGLSARDVAWTRRWSTMWAYKVELNLAPEKDQGWSVDLEGNAPPAWAHADDAKPSLRFLDTSNLRRSVRGRLKKLDDDTNPQSLGLGKDCVQPDVGRLLGILFRAWIEPPSARQFTRRLAPGRTELTGGFESIHMAISGQSFRGAARHWDYSRRDAEQIHIYQGVGAAQAEANDPRAVFTAEKWETLDESANGFRLRRKGGGERLCHLQLIALKPDGARSFILSEVRWLMTGVDGAITIGAAALPGLARAVAIRPAQVGNNQPEPFMQAFLLPGSPSLPQTLVMPSGWYQNGRELELRDEEELRRINLSGQVQRGYDYDRANFSMLD